MKRSATELGNEASLHEDGAEPAAKQPRALPVPGSMAVRWQPPRPGPGELPQSTPLNGCRVTARAEGGREEVSVHEALDRLAREHGGCPAVEDTTGVSWTYSELMAASVQMACGLQEHLGAAAAGTPPPVLAVLMRRTCAWVAACIAGARLGVPVLALSGDLGNADEVQRNREALEEHRPRVVVLDAALRGRAAAEPVLAAAAGGGPVVMDAGALLERSADQALPVEPPQRPGRCADDVLFLVYTGGTTSASKCVAVTHRMALHELAVYPQFSPLTNTDRVLHQASAFWGATSLGIFDIAWCCGACLVLAEDGAGPAEVARVVQRYGITVAGVVPSVLEALEEEPCRSLRVVYTWGEALSPVTAARWGRQVALLDLLIASEYWLILYADHSTCPGRAGFRPVPGARLTLRPPDRESADQGQNGSAEEVKDGEVGELFLAGPMVSAVGYTDAAKNVGAFVDLPVGPAGALIRHFRTRDLARKMPDGSLEYCGRADGFAKVGGKWLDLASVERQLLSAGCKEAALVWDETAKMRHAAVTFDPAAPVTRSLAARTAELQRLLPKDTRLHILPDMPHNAATGKIHRGKLVQALSAATPPTSRAAVPPGAAKVRASLVIGMLLAARAGARGASILPWAWTLAPGLLGPPSSGGRGVGGLLEGLPEGLAWTCRAWVSWSKAVCRCLTPDQMEALPHIALLLMDSKRTGLEGFAKLVRNPLGILGVSVILSRHAQHGMRSLLVAAGRRHAKRTRGGDGWLWAFWLGFASIAERWWHEDMWYFRAQRDADSSISAIGRYIGGAPTNGGRKAGPAAELQELRRCAYCYDWAMEGGGEHWDRQFYCAQCNKDWEDYRSKRHKGEDGTPTVGSSPDDSPRDALAGDDAVLGPVGATDAVDVGEAMGAFVPPDVAGGGVNGASRPAWAPSGGRGRPKPKVDEVDFADYEIRIASTRAPLPKSEPAKSSHPAVAAASAAASPVARIIERVASVDVSDACASLSSLESLKVIQLVSALRRELRLDLAAVDVARCGSLRELEDLCEKASTLASCTKVAGRVTVSTGNGVQSSHSDTERRWAIFAIPQFWKAPVGWLIRLDEVPDEAAMRAACRVLVQRHAGLRAQSYFSSGEEAIAHLCNAAAPVAITLRALLGSFGGGRNGLCGKVGEALFAAWPRTRCVPPEGAGPDPTTGGVRGKEVAHFELRRFATEAELRQAAFLRARSRGFKLPASIGCLVLAGDGGTPGKGLLKGSSGEDVAFLHVAVNHAVSDAASIVPMVADLLELHRFARSVAPPDGKAGAVAEASNGAAAPEAAAAPPPPRHADVEAHAAAARAAAAQVPAPNGLTVQEARLRAALFATGPQDQVPDGTLDVLHSAYNPRRPGYDHYVRLKSGACRVLEVASKALGAPQDHLLVAAIAAAASQLTNSGEVKLSLIVPMRDGKGEGQAVGNLATTRHLNIWFGGGRSLQSAALELSGKLRRREWELCDVLNDDGDRVFINVRSLPVFDGARPVMEAVDTSRGPSRFVRNVIEMFADQESADQWTMWLGIRQDMDGMVFSRGLRKAIWGLAVSPLEPMPGTPPAVPPANDAARAAL